MILLDGFKKIYHSIDCYKAYDGISFLLTGETGAGKEHIAAEIFARSERKSNFVKVNCGSIPETLIESEFFGHEKGAFTTAYFTTKGAFEEANGGTLFLDEIGDLPFTCQSKILRALDEKRIKRIGGRAYMDADFRLICATNMNIDKSKTFRRDLLYRISDIRIEIPPLRDHVQDIVKLADFFLNELNQKYHTEKTLPGDFLKRFEGYEFPGNIRELKSIVKRGYFEDVWKRYENNDFQIAFFDSNLNLSEWNKKLIILALQRGKTQFNAAALLGISPRELHYKIHAVYHLDWKAYQ